jgi:large subunit ribosomal protein L15
MFELSLNRLREFIDTGRLNANQKITIKELVKSKCVTRLKDGVVLLGTGSENFNHKIDIEVTKVSGSAIKRIEEKGGSIISTFFNEFIKQSMLRPDKFAIKPQDALPTRRKDLAYYLDSNKRGYLWKLLQENNVQVDINDPEILKHILELIRNKRKSHLQDELSKNQLLRSKLVNDDLKIPTS